VSQKSSTFDLL